MSASIPINTSVVPHANTSIKSDTETSKEVVSSEVVVSPVATNNSSNQNPIIDVDASSNAQPAQAEISHTDNQNVASVTDNQTAVDNTNTPVEVNPDSA